MKDNYTRFITKDSYTATYENGGPYSKSKWRLVDAYRNELLTSFDNLDNQTYVEKYIFSHNDVIETQRYIGILEDTGTNIKTRKIGKNNGGNLMDYYNNIQNNRINTH